MNGNPDSLLVLEQDCLAVHQSRRCTVKSIRRKIAFNPIGVQMHGRYLIQRTLVRFQKPRGKIRYQVFNLACWNALRDVGGWLHRFL